MLNTLFITAAAAAETESSSEFQFAAAGWLWLLLPLLGLLLLRRRTGAATGIMHPTVRFIAPLLRKPATLAGRIGPICLTLAAMALVTALARPQWKNHYLEQMVSGIDIMIACDLSGSMAQRDMVFRTADERGKYRRTVTDRVTAAKHVIGEFIEGRPNDRMGLVAFAGKAKLCSPLTLDHAILRYIIEQFNTATRHPLTGAEIPGYMMEDGTAIGTAIASAATRLQQRHDTKSKVIVLVTDGANNQGTLPPIEAARQAAALGIRIFTIAIGRDDRISAYTADVDAFDEKTLREIASITGGRYYRASDGLDLRKAFDSIDKLEKTDAKRRTFITYDELFLYPLGLAGALLLFGTVLLLVRPHPAP